MTDVQEWMEVIIGSTPPNSFVEWWCNHVDDPYNEKKWRLAFAWAYDGWDARDRRVARGDTRALAERAAEEYHRLYQEHLQRTSEWLNDPEEIRKALENYSGPVLADIIHRELQRTLGGDDER